MPFGGRSWCSRNRSACRNGSSTASRIASICLAEAADVGVVDVRHLFEDQLLDLALGDPLVGVGRAGLEQQRVAGPQRVVAQHVGEVDDPLLVGVPDDQRAVAAVEDLLEHDDLADALEAARGDDVHRLVEHDLLAVLELARRSTSGETATRSLRPLVKMSTVPSSKASRKTP